MNQLFYLQQLERHKSITERRDKKAHKPLLCVKLPAHLLLGGDECFVIHGVGYQVSGENLPAAVVEEGEQRCKALQLQHSQQVVVVVSREPQESTQLPAQR